MYAWIPVSVFSNPEARMATTTRITSPSDNLKSSIFNSDDNLELFPFHQRFIDIRTIRLCDRSLKWIWREISRRTFVITSIEAYLDRFPEESIADWTGILLKAYFIEQLEEMHSDLYLLRKYLIIDSAS